MPMNRIRARGALAGAVALVGLALAQQASAACRVNAYAFRPQEVRMDMGRVVILPDTPLGAVIKELVVPINERSNIASCNRGGSARGAYVNAAQQRSVPGFSNVHYTDVAGVGIRVYRDSGSVKAYYPHTLNFFGSSSLRLAGGNFRVELVKIAARTGSGPIAPSGRFTTYYFDGDGPARPVLVSFFSGTGTTVVSPTCTVRAGSRNIVVDFGSVSNTVFTGPGTRAANRDFDIQLDCQGSNLAGYQSGIGIRLDGAQDGSGMPGVLGLSPGANNATRIGIELVRRVGAVEQPVRFGETLAIGTTRPGTSLLALPLRARYVQTRAGAVGAGLANATATFTITYD
ncbi:type 1 fimbrial protein [Lysobacter pythonis]|uniref:Type 1 fimbrial protein n=1 Tax=Solilutibacter pythonis TaxID=2483112 RepID=A0A3M2HYM3_9GAMM|nr:fimbrial protein [Lysobacter pythonis]RMH90934.1 type 1 fimbrial protein [Lysobacter pythonis]